MSAGGARSARAEELEEEAFGRSQDVGSIPRLLRSTLFDHEISVEPQDSETAEDVILQLQRDCRSVEMSSHSIPRCWRF